MSNVHTAHCCIIHGCKYGKEKDCTVVLGFEKQEYLCEDCMEEGIQKVKDIEKVLSGKIKTCPHCRHVLEEEPTSVNKGEAENE